MDNVDYNKKILFPDGITNHVLCREVNSTRIVPNELSTYSISVLKLPVDNRIYKNQEGLLLGEESSRGCWCPLGLNCLACKPSEGLGLIPVLGFNHRLLDWAWRMGAQEMLLDDILRKKYNVDGSSPSLTNPVKLLSSFGRQCARF